LLILAKKHLHTTSELHILIAQKLFTDSKLYDYVTSSDLVHCFECYITEIMLISKTLLIMVTVYWAVYSGGSTWGPGGPVPPLQESCPQHLRQLRHALFAILVSDVHMFAWRA